MDRTTITNDFIIQSPLPEIDIPLCDLWSFLQERIIKFEHTIAFNDPVNSRSLSYNELLGATEIIAKNLWANGFSADKTLTISEMKPLIEQLDSEFIVANTKSLDAVKSAISDKKGIKVISDNHSDGVQLLSDLFIKSEWNNFKSKANGNITYNDGAADSDIFSGTGETLKNGVLLYQPLSHMWTMLITLTHFTHGQRVMVMPEPDLKKYVSLVSEYKIERLHVAPPCAVYLCKSGITSQYSLSHVRYISSSAATLQKEIEEELSEVLGHGTQIVQLFGASEVGAALAVPFKPGVQATSGSVGWPISNTSAKIIDCSSGVNVGPHNTGELCIKTRYPMKGYLGYSGMSSQFFDKDGFYKTGDLAYYNEKGCIFIVDRVKEVIKVGGAQVPPAFLEVLLLTHPSVADAGVTSVPHLEYVEVPHAWVVKKPGKDVTEDELHEFVNERVNDLRRIRGGIKFVEAIPKSPSGKILRRIIKEQSTPDRK